jgi:galactokinase/mevalonate kinase-like predicted kinase
MPSLQKIVSLPPNGARHIAETEGLRSPEWVACCDPEGRRLGSGGGTVHALLTAWRETGRGESFPNWIRTGGHMVIHAGGLSRRLPAYAAAGKALMPMPVWRWSRGQRLDQSLLDLQATFSARVFEHAPPDAIVGVASGDALLRCGEIPEIPAGDVVALGLWVSSERASRHGVFFCERRPPHALHFFLQKPEPDEITRQARDRLFLIDSGFWLLSEQALRVLFAKSGVDYENPGDACPDFYELYAEFGLSLGLESPAPDPAIGPLRAAVCPLSDGGFHHFGSGRDLVDSTLDLQNLVVDQRHSGGLASRPHPSVFIQNATVAGRLRSSHSDIWIENSTVGTNWTMSREHIITGVPDNDWSLRLSPGTCLDVVPLAGDRLVPRAYGMDDRFRGALGDPDTHWLGRPFGDWLAERGLGWATTGLDPAVDIFDAPLFPVVPKGGLAGEFVQWLVGAAEGVSPVQQGELLNLPVGRDAPGDGTSQAETTDVDWSAVWLAGPRVSARELGDHADLPALYAQRREHLLRAIPRLLANYEQSVLFRLDLGALAALCRDMPELPDVASDSLPPLVRAQAHAFLAEWHACRRAGAASVEAHMARASDAVRDAVLDTLQADCQEPVRQLLPDQIVWARSPVRLDLAGGWTDTPPFCFMAGGNIANLAVDLNGQPPIQVFVRPLDEPLLKIRSIDQGSELLVTKREQLADYANVGSSFALCKGAFALAGFLPPYGGRAYGTLAEQLADFGGGLEVSLLAAIPKGSGLGTSSILGATMLGALSDVCGLGWSDMDLVERTLALEQLLTTGGGWQDQAGGLFPGIKLLSTGSELDQKPVVRWLPSRLFTEHSQSILLYYTGMTRMAKDILKQVVRHVLLNSADHLGILRRIGQAAADAAEAIQQGDYAELARVVDRSRELNGRLDPGSYPPSIEALLAPLRQWLLGAKLLGAGGGGYVLMFAQDAGAAERIREYLVNHPPNDRARFVDVSISNAGLQITRS